MPTRKFRKALFGQPDAQTVVGVGMVRVDAQCVAIVLHRFAHLTGARQGRDARQLHVAHDKIGPLRELLPAHLLRFGQLLVPDQFQHVLIGDVKSDEVFGVFLALIEGGVVIHAAGCVAQPLNVPLCGRVNHRTAVGVIPFVCGDGVDIGRGLAGVAVAAQTIRPACVDADQDDVPDPPPLGPLRLDVQVTMPSTVNDSRATTNTLVSVRRDIPI